VAESPTLVSVVVPALDEADNLDDLVERCLEAKRSNPGYDFELVLVDDGSSDGTATAAVAAAEGRLSLTVVELARSFGSHQAISAGFHEARGRCAIVVGADAQEPPSLIGQFLRAWEQGAEIVWGVRRTRAPKSWLSEIPSRAFSFLFSRFANLQDYPPEGPSGMLLDRVVIDRVNTLTERNRNVMALISWLGFRQERVLYDQLTRRSGASKWTRAKMMRLAADSLLQFSTMPLRLCTYAGMGIAMLGVLYAAFLVVRAIAGVPTPSGWPTLLVVVLVLGGAQLTLVGVMGEYLWRAVEETRARPLFVIRQVTTNSVLTEDNDAHEKSR
jgi:glycosyltransferase involved in cell wall biosynthesis